MSICYGKAGIYVPGTGDFIWKTCLRKKRTQIYLGVFWLWACWSFSSFSKAVQLWWDCWGHAQDYQAVVCQSKDKQLQGPKMCLSSKLPTVSPVEVTETHEYGSVCKVWLQFKWKGGRNKAFRSGNQTLPHLGLKDKCLPRDVGSSLRMENMTHFPLNFYTFEVKGLLGKKLLWYLCPSKRNPSVRRVASCTLPMETSLVSPMYGLLWFLSDRWDKIPWEKETKGKIRNHNSPKAKQETLHVLFCQTF